MALRRLRDKLSMAINVCMGQRCTIAYIVCLSSRFIKLLMCTMEIGLCIKSLNISKSCFRITKLRFLGLNMLCQNTPQIH